MLIGAVSALFIKSIYGFEDFFEKRIKGNYYTRHMSGMLLVGIMLYLLMTTTGHYYIEGVGYSTIQDILLRTFSSIRLLLLLFALKLLATSLTLGSGASGGIFSPALYLGATLGAAYGLILQQLFPGLVITPAAFAVAGMAGVVGGVTGAAMAAIVMIFEMTLDYNVIIPMTITVAVSYGVRKLLSKESIYTLKLVRRGHYMPEALQTNMHFLKRAKEMMEIRFATVPASQRLEEFMPTLLQQTPLSQLLVEDGHRVVGFITKEAALESAKQPGKTSTLGEMASKNYVIVSEETTLFEVINRMRSTNAAIALVLPDGQVASAEHIEGVITKEDVADSMVAAVELFSD